MTAVLVISAADNVATALDPIAAGAFIQVNGVDVTAIDPIPRGHKIALRAIAAGEAIVKYGSPIGTASTDIPVGAHVHTHNLASGRGRGDLAAASDGGQTSIRHPSDTGAGRIAEPADPDL